MSRDPNRSTRILSAAARLMAHYGYDKTTMDDIAREAGVSKGALYLEWSGKEPLFQALLEHEMQRLLADFQTRIQLDPRGGTIGGLYRHALLALQANPLVAALYTRDQRILGDFIQRQDPQRYTSRLRLLEESIPAMQAAGALRADLSPEVIAYLFGVIAVGFIYVGSALPTTQAIPLDVVAEALADVIQRGFGGDDSENHSGPQAMQRLADLVARQYQQPGSPAAGENQ